MVSPVPRALLKALGVAGVPVVRCTLAFHAPKQDRFQPPSYRVEIDTEATPWLTCRHYNVEPRALELSEVRVPTEMTRFTVTVKKGPKRAITQWAKRLLARES